MGVFTTGIFNAPRYSSFPWSHDNKISMSAGKITPIGWEFLNTGDKFESDVADVCRLAPMLAPTLDTYKIDIHAFALRLRSLGHVTKDPWSYEDFFNLNKNVDGSLQLPSIPLTAVLATNGFRNGTLFETLGMPTFKKEREDYLSFIREKFPEVYDPVVMFAQFPAGTSPNIYESTGFHPASSPLRVMPYSASDPLPVIERSAYAVADAAYVVKFGDQSNAGVSHSFYNQLGLIYGNSPYAAVGDLAIPFRSCLISYIAQKYPEVVPFDFIYDELSIIPHNLNLTLTDPLPAWIEEFNGKNLLDEVYRLYKKDSVSVLKEFEDYLLDGLLGMMEQGALPNLSRSYYGFTGYPDLDDSLSGYRSYFWYLDRLVYAVFSDLPSVDVLGVSALASRMIPVYPFDAYYKIISDWYINTALFEPDQFFVDHSFLKSYTDYINGGTALTFRNTWRSLNELFRRYWNNDYFTSAFPSPQAGSAVGIPVNGTIVDLRNANAMQKLKERLLYAGSRFRDVLFAITGKKTSAAILEMSEVIGQSGHIINVDSVLQQSASENGSPQAGYAGTGLGYKAGSKNIRYVAEEPTIILIVASIRPVASYFQGISKKFLRGNVYDYAIPQLANVGEQSINIGELYLGRDINTSVSGFEVFGYTRRNGDWMWTPSEIHGDFRGSLDYWHNARIFGSIPHLSESFLQVRPAEDNLNRIFAVQSDSYDHFYCEFSFTGHVVRSLPKHVHYDL